MSEQSTIDFDMERFRLDESVAVVTGGSRGIGAAIASALSAAGARVAVASRTAAQAEASAQAIGRRTGRQTLGCGCDVTDPDALSSLLQRVDERLGPCCIYVHAAGLSSVGMAAEAGAAELQRMLDVHYLAAVRGAQLARERMLGGHGGVVLFVTSVWGLGGQTAALAYGGAKAAMAQAVKVLAIEWARDGIRVNGLAPGLVDTEMTAGMDQRTRDSLIKRIPLRRAAQAAEMAGPALFLCSPAASYLTGQILVVDGGERAR